MKERPIDGDLEQLFDETRDKRDRQQQHLTVYQSLCMQLEAAAKLAGKSEHDKVMRDYEEYGNLVLEAEEFARGRIELKNGQNKRSNGFQITTRDK